MKFLLLLSMWQEVHPEPAPGVIVGREIRRTVTFHQEVSAASSSAKGSLDSVTVHVALPVDDVRQSVLKLEINPKPVRVEQDEFGQRLAVFEAARLESGTSMHVSWTADVLLRDIEYRVDPERLLRVGEEPAPVKASFLGDGSRYKLTDEGLRAAAREAGKGETNPLKLAANIDAFVRNAVSYSRDGRWDPAPVVLRSGSGSCSEYSFLYIALCRLNRLPARHAGGSALRIDVPEYEDPVFHRWSEVYLAGFGWFPVDVTKNDEEDGTGVDLAFGRTDANLLVVARGDGGDERPLEWDYVSAVRAERRSGAVTRISRRYVWSLPTALPDPNLAAHPQPR
jgi:transglutaminase-like putative cysteine protease